MCAVSNRERERINSLLDLSREKQTKKNKGRRRVFFLLWRRFFVSADRLSAKIKECQKMPLKSFFFCVYISPPSVNAFFSGWCILRGLK